MKPSIVRPQNTNERMVKPPTRPYLHRACKPERPLVILDLDGVLVHRVNGVGVCAGADGEYVVNDRQSVWFRPGVLQFLAELQRTCDIAVWTAAMEHNAKPIVDFIFAELGFEPAFFFTQKECTPVDVPGRSWPLFKKNVLVTPVSPKRPVLFVDDSEEKMYPELQRFYVPRKWTPYDDHPQSLDEVLTEIHLRLRPSNR